jgi:hypothetical protein
MSTIQIVLLILVLAVIVVVGFVAMRHQRLRRRFGPEYDQVVSEQDSRISAERELRDRERRHEKLELRELDPATKERFAHSWQDVQARFVTDPAGAVVAGDELVTRLVRERGYPTEGYEDELSYLSVDHARVLGHYRDAHEIYLRGQRGQADTEELRQALVHYRALFADLLGVEPVTSDPVNPPVSRERRTDWAATDRDTDLADRAADRNTDRADDRRIGSETDQYADRDAVRDIDRDVMRDVDRGEQPDARRR